MSMSVCMKATLPLASAICAIGLFTFSRALCNVSVSPLRDTVGEDPALKQVEMLRAEVYRGQSDLLQALENAQVQLQHLRLSTKDAPVASVESSTKAVPTSVLPVPTAAPRTEPVTPATAAPLQAVTAGPLPALTAKGVEGNGKGPIWDSKVAAIEMKAEKQYWYQRHEKNAMIHPGFIKYNSNWPCLWGEEYTGQGSGDGNKWTCGARLIQSPCVVYSFGSNNDMKFEMGIHELGLNCEIHIYDPTVKEPAQAKSIGAKYHRVGLGPRDGFMGRYPVKTLKSLMAENGHKHIDILKVDIEDAEHEAIPQIAVDGWPSIGQFLVEVHIRGVTTDLHLDRIFQLVEKANLRLFHQEVNWEFGPGCCTEYAFIHKNWRPETKKYDMKQAITYQEITQQSPQRPQYLGGWGARRRP